MTRRSKIGLVAAVLFSLVNALGAVYAAVHGELLHTAIHAALLLVGEFFIFRLAPRRRMARY